MTDEDPEERAMTRMPELATERLTIRPFVADDLDAIYRILDGELAEADFGSEGAKALDDRRQWLEWTTMNYEQLARLYQPHYGDRAIVLKSSGELIGAVGFVPSFGPFGQLPSRQSSGAAPGRGFTPEFGPYYVVSPARQRKGYAVEAAWAMIDYAFTALDLQRIVATTTYNNVASIGVMRKLGMRVEKNPLTEPAWFQVVGILDNKGDH
jgi:RimJ/RimL family protein N-acetyltransferase